jgi:hypothetical protein
MNDPTRFTEMEPDNPEAALLRSMRSDTPGTGSRQALLGALGLSAVASLTGSAAASPVGSGWAGSGLAKWLGAVGVCGAVLGAGYAAWNSGTSDSRAAPSASGAPRPAAVAVVAVPPERQAVLPTGQTRPVTSPEEPGSHAGSRGNAVQPARAPERRESPTASARGLADEVAALERARRALGDEDGATALKSLSEYDRQFKQRTLGPEADALRIEALLKSGNQAAGKAAAERFLARYPKSPLAKRVRSLLAQTASSR